MFLKLLLFLVHSSWFFTNAIEIGDRCENNYYCGNIPNAECRNNVCQCTTSTTKLGNNCLEDVQPKMLCTSTSECTISNIVSICVENYCRCQSYFHFRDGGCYKNKGYPEYCRETKECIMGQTSIGSMVCTNFRCECNDGYEFERGRCRNNSNRNFPEIMFVIIMVMVSLLITWASFKQT